MDTFNITKLNEIIILASKTAISIGQDVAICKERYAACATGSTIKMTQENIQKQINSCLYQ